MRYLQIPDSSINTENGLYELIWPEDAREEHDYILYKNVYLVRENHPNIAFILMKVDAVSWYDDETGPVKFINYPRSV